MPPRIESSYQLIDAQQRLLGHMAVERMEGELLLGRFEPGPEFATVEVLFRAFEEAVDCQALAVADDRAAVIEALGLRLCLPDGSQCLAIRDVQIWTDGGMTCRLSGTDQAEMRGTELQRHQADQVISPGTAIPWERIKADAQAGFRA